MKSCLLSGYSRLFVVDYEAGKIPQLVPQLIPQLVPQFWLPIALPCQVDCIACCVVVFKFQDMAFTCC